MKRRCPNNPLNCNSLINNSEIMNIIKSLSKSYLVILVTHEEELGRK